MTTAQEIGARVCDSQQYPNFTMVSSFLKHTASPSEMFNLHDGSLTHGNRSAGHVAANHRFALRQKRFLQITAEKSLATAARSERGSVTRSNIQALRRFYAF